ncbi:GNAT family N-acetyltransferase [Lewinella sp. 4G2]|uniref:GNAT family N-acetyltransferase n=1 Tax=Lewinella sp. 4G2 TaxID=1803372 RepID=UPI0007B4AC39|nr:GNAT family N-acetyltransferase [Lewinella sp. 4G2]OAV45688.1 acetyltransferase [Lewinella sp. 4G2]
MTDYLIRTRKFEDLNINDIFFDSLKKDYVEFEDWFMAKSKKGRKALVVEIDNKIIGFLYLKHENEQLPDINPPLPIKKRMKVGTFKVNPHGTRLGERFMKKIFDYATQYNYPEIYVTIFPKHKALVSLFIRYGFKLIGTKTTHNGIENVYLKDFNTRADEVLLDYPMVDTKKNSHLLAIKPKFHSLLFPDSILSNESFDVLEDISHTNSIHKIYVCFMNISSFKKGDNVVIYRTKDDKGSAEYRSVATSICRVEEVRSKHSFSDSQEFITYCKKYSVFDEQDLTNWFKNDNFKTIKMTYNVAFKKRITRNVLINEIGLDRNQYWGFFHIDNNKFIKIIKKSEINESIIFD